MKFVKPPKSSPLLDSHMPPMGPGGIVEKVRILGNPKVERKVEKVYGDTDLKASEAIVNLYKEGVRVSMIQRLLSIGALGIGRYRRLVPTRWSITTVDDIVSKKLIGEIKDKPWLDRIEVFVRRYAKNLFIAILVPGAWSFEWMEAWFPRTTWNPGREVEIEGDYELYSGRKSYASIGGCYYAARLATAEYLVRIGRQATAVLLREIYEGFDLPLGVWFVRENLRRMYRERSQKFNTLSEALGYASKFTRIPFKEWIRNSKLLRLILRQETLDAYIFGGLVG